MIHRVVLEINHDNGNPGKWDWPDLLSEQVDLISVTELPELSNAQVNFLTELRQAHSAWNMGDALDEIRDMSPDQIMALCNDGAVYDAETVRDFEDSIEDLISAYGPKKTLTAILPGAD